MNINFVVLRRILISLSLLLSLTGQTVSAQSFEIKGEILERIEFLNKKKKVTSQDYYVVPLGSVAIVLNNVKGDTLHKIKADHKGRYKLKFTLPSSGKYYLRYMKTGYMTKITLLDISEKAKGQTFVLPDWDLALRKQVPGLPAALYTEPYERYYYDEKEEDLTEDIDFGVNYDEKYESLIYAQIEKRLLTQEGQVAANTEATKKTEELIAKLPDSKNEKTITDVNEAQERARLILEAAHKEAQEIIARATETAAKKHSETPKDKQVKEGTRQEQKAEQIQQIDTIPARADNKDINTLVSDIENKKSLLKAEKQKLEFDMLKAVSEKDKLNIRIREAQLKTQERELDLAKSALENKEKEIIHRDESLRNRNYILLLFIALIVVFIVLIIIQVRNIKKSKRVSELLKKQNELIHEKRESMLASINYAKRIQTALLKDEDHITSTLPAHFILFKPRDIVSGDFYWNKMKGKYWYVASVDCTGHGVPGAFMSMLGVSFLNEIMTFKEQLHPAEILEYLREKVITELSQKGRANDTKDGMDMALIRIDLETLEMEYSGAKNSLYVVSDNKLTEYKADKDPIGFQEQMGRFTNNIIQLKKKDICYMSTDGYPDQFGGEKDKKYTYKRLREKLLAVNELPMETQKKLLEAEFNEWKRDNEQVDDVCLVSVRV